MQLLINKLHPDAIIPSFAHEGDAGMDIYSLEDATITSLETKTIKTGLKMAIPLGYAGFIWDKSGLAAKHSITTLAGVIDSNYRGELLIVLHNLGETPYVVEKSSKIAQLTVLPCATPQVIEGPVSDETNRGEGGFGSTGTH